MINIFGYIILLMALYDIGMTIKYLVETHKIIGISPSVIFSSITIEFFGDILVVIFVIAKVWF